MSEQNTPFDPFHQTPEEKPQATPQPQTQSVSQEQPKEDFVEIPTTYTPGYGGFGRKPAPQAQDIQRESISQEEEKTEPVQDENGGLFYGPDCFLSEETQGESDAKLDLFGGSTNQNEQPVSQSGTVYNPFARQGDGMTPPPSPEQKTGKNFAIASLVCGILSIVLCCCNGFIPLILAVVAVVMAILQSKKDGRMDGKAVGGLVTGIIGAFIALVSILLSFSDAYQTFIEEFMQEMENGNFEDVFEPFEQKESS